MKLKEQLLGFLFLAPIFVAIPVACLEQAEPPAGVAAEHVVTAPLSMKAVIDAERDDSTDEDGVETEAFSILP